MARKRPEFGENGYKRVENDLYRTPAWVTKYLLEILTIRGTIVEPACGRLDMVRPIAEAGFNVVASDLDPPAGIGIDKRDFLSAEALEFYVNLRPDWIITNPPYTASIEFIERALEISRLTNCGVAMLLAFDFDAAPTRRHLFNHRAFSQKIYVPGRIIWVGMEKLDRKTKRLIQPRKVHAWYVWRQFTQVHAQNVYPKMTAKEFAAKIAA